MRRFTLATVTSATLAVLVLSGVTSPELAVGADRTGTPRPAGTTKLSAVSASRSTDAWSVGFRTLPGGPTLALTRHWDGIRWRTVPSAHPSENSFLWGVADLSPTDAWAVGEWIGEATIQAFVEHWNGTDWEVVPMRGAPGLGKFNAVSANGPDDVWFVGTGYPSPRQTPRAFFAHWDGTRIHRVRPGKLERARTTELTSITAVAADDVWAVGAHGRHGQTYLPLVEHFDGTSWTVVPTDLAAGMSADLTGVDAVSGTDAWVVGWEAPNGQPTVSALVEHWDGTEWTHSPALTPGYSSNLTSVSVVATDDVWAVGTWIRSEQHRTSLPLIEHWDGQAWSIVDAPSKPHAATYVQSVSMDGASDGFAVGETTYDAQTSGYTVHWDGQAWTR